MDDIAFGGLDEHGENIISAEEEERNERVMYGDLVLSIAPKENKANTLLASCLFSPSFFLAEKIEMGLLPVSGKTVLELGAGAALPSLLLSRLPQDQSPSLIVATDYPDPTILGNLQANAERNAQFKHREPESGFRSSVDVIVEGYKWGDDPTHVLRHLPLVCSSHDDPPSGITNRNAASAGQGFDILILSDLLHFGRSHAEIIQSIVYMLKRAAWARAYVVAGKYTRREICESFIAHAAHAGLVWDEFDYEGTSSSDAGNAPSVGSIAGWRGILPILVGKRVLRDDELVGRRDNCWGWVGKWGEGEKD